MQIQAKTNCPLNQFQPCKELECAWFMKVAGKDPQKDTEIEEWGCAIPWIPIFLMENNRVTFQTGAAVESFRNEMVKSNEISNQVLLAAAQFSNPELKVIEVKK